MFGRLKVQRILEVQPGCKPEAAVAVLVEGTGAKVRKWIEFPASLLVLMMSPENGSGAIFTLDRKVGRWYWVYFEGEELRGYTEAEFQALVEDYGFLDLVERPGLLRTDLPWVLQAGEVPVASV